MSVLARLVSEREQWARTMEGTRTPPSSLWQFAQIALVVACCVAVFAYHESIVDFVSSLLS
jgi:hypothetical protein